MTHVLNQPEDINKAEIEDFLTEWGWEPTGEDDLWTSPAGHTDYYRLAFWWTLEEKQASWVRCRATVIGLSAALTATLLAIFIYVTYFLF